MSDSNKDKLQALISSSDLETVRQGFALAESLISSPADLFDIFDIPSGASQTVDIVEACKELEHRGQVVHWIFTTLEEQGVQWSIERERTFDVILYPLNGRPFTYYVSKITKEQYMFWKDNGGTDMNKDLYRYLSVITSPDFWPKDVQPEELSIQDARYALEEAKKDDYYSKVLQNIPDEALILPKEEGLYQFDDVRGGWVMYLEDPSKVVLEVREQIGDQELTFWSGTLDDFRNSNSANYITAQVQHKKIRKDEYFMDFFQSERANLFGRIKKTGSFDINALQIHESVDENTGLAINHDSIYYDNEKVYSDWDCYSAQPYEPSLYEGLNLYTKKESE